uniref:DUF7882 family protein n=1 Tax=Subtercola lobariae TaxID=1588641 RepID=UPI0027DE5653|nr:ATP-dependent DNA ligase [Subtercola lobariae]
MIVQKLRRSESFAMSWAVSAEFGSGRSSIWLHPSIPIHFRFNGSRVPAINPAWLAELTTSANSSTGLIVTPENPRATGAIVVQPAPRQRERHLEPA